MKNNYILIFYIFIFSICFYSCSTPENDTTKSTTFNLKLKTEKVLVYDYTVLELEILKMINEYRVSKGLNALGVINHISYVASVHGRAMIANKTLSHQFFDERINNIATILNASSVGENLAFNFSSAEVVVKLWVESPEHKAIIEGDFTHFGISVLLSPEEKKNYCTNIFAKIK